MHLLAVVLLFLQLAAASPSIAVDSDHDGLSDELEQSLLVQFVPRFMVSRQDCSMRPARLAAFDPVPKPIADDGTIYAQAFPRQGHSDEVELHFYHLWRTDCGELSHPFDAEHVSVLLKQGRGEGANRWTALYWYAAAHEDTVCDASQMTRAATINAETQGAQVWISAGKHASFLNERLCTNGCGGDQCNEMDTLPISDIVNLGEAAFPMNGAQWVKSPVWPLLGKLQRCDFTDARLTRMENLPGTDIAWANPTKRPMQAAILGGNSGIRGAATGARSTNTALTIANDQADSAMQKAARSTGNALGKSYRNVRKALGRAAGKTGEALGGQSPD